MASPKLYDGQSKLNRQMRYHAVGNIVCVGASVLDAKQASNPERLISIFIAL
jgi:hypothetical protein